MNIPKAVELGFADIIRDAEIGEGVVIRAWQSLSADGSWSETPDREFPMIDIRCSPPRSDDNQATLNVECAITMATKTDDDKDHLFISNMYDAVQEVCNNLFKAFRTGSKTDEPLATFLAAIQNEVASAEFDFGGLTFGEGVAPFDDNGANAIGINMVVHYSRSDF